MENPVSQPTPIQPQPEPTLPNPPKPRSKFPFILGGIVLLLVVVGIGTLVMGTKTSSPNMETLKKPPLQPSITQVTTPSPTPINYDQLISYTLLPGWTKTTFANGTESWPAITSPDFTVQPEGMFAGRPKTGILIYFYRAPNTPSKTIDELENEYKNTAGIQNVSQTIIGGKQALYDSVAYEGIREGYTIIDGNYRWTIGIEPPNTSPTDAQNALAKHKNEINQFLTSIKFTPPAGGQNQTTDTSNWKTYKTSDFSFQYPPDWELSPASNQTSVTLFSPNNKTTEFKDNISILKRDNPKNLSIEEFVSNPMPATTYHFKTITIDGLEGKQALDVPSSNGYIDYYSKKGSAIYEIVLHSDSYQSYQNLFNQIVSTFKFTN